MVGTYRYNMYLLCTPVNTTETRPGTRSTGVTCISQYLGSPACRTQPTPVELSLDPETNKGSSVVCLTTPCCACPGVAPQPLSGPTGGTPSGPLCDLCDPLDPLSTCHRPSLQASHSHLPPFLFSTLLSAVNPLLLPRSTLFDITTSLHSPSLSLY